MRMTKQEIHDLKLSIQNESVMLSRVKKMFLSSLTVLALAALFVFVILKAEQYSTWRIVLIAVMIVSGLLALMSILSYMNGCRHLLKKMNTLDANK